MVDAIIPCELSSCDQIEDDVVFFADQGGAHVAQGECRTSVELDFTDGSQWSKQLTTSSRLIHFSSNSRKLLNS